jgi:hypothetical protein
MIEIILLLIACFVAIIFFLPFVALFIADLISIFKPSKRVANYETRDNGKTDNQTATETDEEETTDGDGLMLFGDEMFPPSFDDEY